MVRLIFLAMFLLCLAAGALIILGLLRWVGGPMPAQKEEAKLMSKQVRSITYSVLLILMVGVTSGILGAG